MNDVREYEPEMGQALFGQPRQEFEVPEIMDAALQYIRYELERVRWNIRQQDSVDPFGNGGPSGDYESDVMSVCAYSWDEAYDQPWNFKCGDVRISWYKYMGRGMSANVKITPDLASDILLKCLSHLREVEELESTP